MAKRRLKEWVPRRFDPRYGMESHESSDEKVEGNTSMDDCCESRGE